MTTANQSPSSPVRRRCRILGETGAWRLAALCLLSLCRSAYAQPQTSFRWTTNYYVVTGATFPEISDSISHSRPPRLQAPMSGLTEWSIRWHMRVEPSEHGVRCASFTTQTTITNTLPFWRMPTNAAYRTKMEWARYAGNLALHENGHSRIALAALAEVHKAVKGLSEAPDHPTLWSMVNQTVERVLDKYRREEVEYDRLTAHGSKQFAGTPQEPAGPQ